MFCCSRLQSFNTQPPEGGCRRSTAGSSGARRVSTHSRPKAAAVVCRGVVSRVIRFQHTAARRRLQARGLAAVEAVEVSTHSRPKAAACRKTKKKGEMVGFQHTAARRRLQSFGSSHPPPGCFNTQPPEGGCRSKSRFPAASPPFQHTAARRRLLVVFRDGQDGSSQVSTHSRPKAAADI